MNFFASPCFLFFFFFFSTRANYTSFDVKIILRLNKFIHAKCLLILCDYEDVYFLEQFKKFTGSGLLLAAISSNDLDNHLQNYDFFQHKTLLVSKQTFNLSAAITKSPRPGIITFVIFQHPNIYRDHFIPINTDVFFIHTKSNSPQVTVYLTYNIKPSTNWTMTSTNEWEPTKPEFEVDLSKNNFGNVSLDMHVLLDDNFCVKLQGKDIITKVECLHHDIVRLIGSRLNFTVKTIECIEKENPYTYPNGSESELFIKLRRREVDISVASHLIWKKRFKSFDFVWPTFVLKTMMYIKQSSYSGHWTSYLRPLDTSLWWGILGIVVSVGIFLEIFQKLVLGRLRLTPVLLPECIHSTLTVLQIFCNQGISYIPSTHSVRFLYLLTFFVVLVIFQAYTGYLMSSLTIVQPYFPFLDLNGFFRNKKYKIMTIRRGFHKFFYKSIIGGNDKLRFLLEYGLPNTTKEAVDKLCHQDYLVFSEFREELLDLDLLSCRISELPYPVASIYMTMVLPKNSPFTEIVNRERIYLESTGLMQRMRTRLSATSYLYESQSPQEYLTVSLAQVFSLFFLLGIGIFLSVLIFFVELLIKTKNDRKVINYK